MKDILRHHPRASRCNIDAGGTTLFKQGTNHRVYILENGLLPKIPTPTWYNIVDGSEKEERDIIQYKEFLQEFSVETTLHRNQSPKLDQNVYVVMEYVPGDPVSINDISISESVSYSRMRRKKRTKSNLYREVQQAAN